MLLIFTKKLGNFICISCSMVEQVLVFWVRNASIVKQTCGGIAVQAVNQLSLFVLGTRIAVCCETQRHISFV